MRSFKHMFTSKMFRAGSYATFAAVIIIAIVVVANLAVSALPTTATQIDLTEQSLYSLSDQTKRIVSSLGKEVDLYLLSNTGSENATITNLLGRYGDLSDQIKVEYIDPTEKPTFLNNYSLDLSTLYANSVLVVCGDKNRLVSYADIFVTDYSMNYNTYSYDTTTTFDGENALTNAIHYVSSANLPKIFTLTGHGESALSDTITTAIAQDNLETADLSLLTLEAVPEDADCVLINAPTGDINEDEAKLLTAYLTGGGRVLLITDYIASGEMPNLLSVTAAMGMTTGEGMVVEGDANMCLRNYAWYLLPTINSHDITDPLISGGYYILYPMAQPIVAADGSAASVSYLLTTSDSSYAKAAAYSMTSADKEDGDTDGPFNLAAAATLGDGQMVWFTSANLLNEQMDSMVSGANSDLFLNALNWMCEQEETISIRSKSLDSTGLTLTTAQNSMWSILLVGAVPAAFILVGILIWVRRKRQ